MTALTTLYAAHKYMCPGLARLVVAYLRENLSEKNVLLVLQHICLYCTSSSPAAKATASANADPSPPPAPIYWEEEEATAITKSPSPRAFDLSEPSSSPAPSAPPLSSIAADHEENSPLLDEEAPNPASSTVELVTEDDLREFEVGMAVSDEKGRVNCCAALLRDCLELIDRRATAVLKSEDVEDVDVSALKLVVCRGTLNVKSEFEVADALLRWSGRECKRQRMELTPMNRRSVLEGGQYLVRWLTLPAEEFLRSSADSLLTEEEREAILAAILASEGGMSGGNSMMPDHLSGLRAAMSEPRRKAGKDSTTSRESKAKRFGRSIRLRRSDLGRKEKEKAMAEAAAAERDRRKVEELKERSKRKFNLVEEFFMCLACIFD